MEEISRHTQWRNKNIEHARQVARNRYKLNKEHILQLNNEWRSRNLEYLIWHRAKQRARYNEIEFDLEISDIIIPEVCPLLGVTLVHGSGDESPALDRINNLKGYVKNNVWVISQLANRMKNSATINQLETFCTNWMMLHRPDMDDRWRPEGKRHE
jgi:hypothetical protein